MRARRLSAAAATRSSLTDAAVPVPSEHVSAPDTPTTLVLIRHGESNVTVNRVIGGHRTCSGLSQLGQRQAQRLSERIATTTSWRPTC